MLFAFVKTFASGISTWHARCFRNKRSRSVCRKRIVCWSLFLSIHNVFLSFLSSFFKQQARFWWLCVLCCFPDQFSLLFLLFNYFADFATQLFQLCQFISAFLPLFIKLKRGIFYSSRLSCVFLLTRSG